jgi:polyisoprenoid-binding protein YceI
LAPADCSQRAGAVTCIGPAASGTLNREDWGLTWNLPVDSGGVLVSKDIRIEIELEAVLQQ